MAGGWIVEHVGPVTDGDDEGFFRKRELHAQTAADAPTQSSRGRAAEISFRFAQVEHFIADTVIAQHDGVAVTHLIDAVRQPSVADRPVAARLLGFLLHVLTIFLMPGADVLGALRKSFLIARSFS